MTDEPRAARRGRSPRYAADKKAIDIVELDLRGVAGYTDYFVICSGNTDRQAKAIHDGIHQGLKKEHGLLPRRVEGAQRGALDPHGLPRRASCTSSRPRRATSTGSSSCGATSRATSTTRGTAGRAAGGLGGRLTSAFRGAPADLFEEPSPRLRMPERPLRDRSSARPGPCMLQPRVAAALADLPGTTPARGAGRGRSAAHGPGHGRGRPRAASSHGASRARTGDLLHAMQAAVEVLSLGFVCSALSASTDRVCGCVVSPNFRTFPAGSGQGSRPLARSAKWSRPRAGGTPMAEPLATSGACQGGQAVRPRR